MKLRIDPTGIIILAFFCYGMVQFLMQEAEAGPLDETVFCGPPPRDADGDIIRSSAITRAFKKLHPCPSTHLTFGPCPGWIMDHPKPLACGYCDSVDNMQWLPYEMWLAKSKWELKVYGGKGMSARCP